MASIDPRTMKQSGFWLEKCEIPKICAYHSGVFQVSSKVLISGRRSCLHFVSNCARKFALFGDFLLRTAVGNLKLAYAAVVDS